MSGLYADGVLDAIARANDIVGVVQNYFPLRRAGRDYTALCPFHPEKTPSFTVSPGKQIFKCFGCGRGGSVFNFIMLKENVTFPEAVRILAERAGIQLKTSPEARRQAGRQQQFRKVLDWATRHFQGNLGHPEGGSPARRYLAGRGITEVSVEAFRIGFAPESWDALLKAGEAAGIPAQALEAAGLVVRREDGGCYDRFRNRVMFPILDTLNRPIAFGGRTLGDDAAKYLNSPETALFRKAENLYGLPQARPSLEKDRRVAVVEGYFDVVMPHQVGVANVVATLGTALTAEHVRLLKRYADDVVLVFDSDLAGQRAADRGVELFLAEDVRVYVAALPEGKDPFDVCREGGAEALRDRLAQARDAFEYKWDLVRKEFRAAESPAAQRRALEAVLASLAHAPVLTSRGPSLRRDLLLARISQTLGVSQEALRSELARIRRQAGRTAAGAQVGANLPAPAVRGRRWVAERDLLTVLVHRPSRLQEAAEALPPGGLRTETFRRLYEAVRSSEAPRDNDLESIVRHLEDPDLASLAVELYERGEAIEACRREDETGPGPLAAMLAEALEALRRIEAEENVVALSETVSRKTSADEDVRDHREYLEASKRRRECISPLARRRRKGGT